MKEILEILERDARATPKEIARMLGMAPKTVASTIKKMEKDGVILKYKAIINKDSFGVSSRISLMFFINTGYFILDTSFL